VQPARATGLSDQPADPPLRASHPDDLIHLDVKKLSRIPARGTVREADWAGLEQNADNVPALTLDTLRAEVFIDRARTAPYPEL
jgi:hypothetical protein